MDITMLGLALCTAVVVWYATNGDDDDLGGR